MPSTRSTSSSDGERKPNTRSKGGGGGGGGGSKATSWNCTKPLSQGRGLTKTLSTHCVNRSKNNQMEQDLKHGGRKGSKVSESKVTISKTDQGPVEKNKRGRKPLSVTGKTKETVISLEEVVTMSDSHQKVKAANGSACDQKTSLEASSNLSTGSENNHSQSANLLNGNQVEVSRIETSDDIEHNGNVTSNGSSNSNANSVCNSMLQKEEPALFEIISPEEMYLSVAIPTANELELLEESCDVKTNDVSHAPDDSNSISGADNPQNEISNYSDTVCKKNVSDNPLTAQGVLQTKQIDPNAVHSDNSSKKKKIRRM